jgi:trehalose 6-phosphate synthase
MMAKLHAGTIQQWFADFVDALRETQGDKAAVAPAMPEPPASWALRSVNSSARYH